MNKSYTYLGHPGFKPALENYLDSAGLNNVDNPSNADFIITYCTNLSQLEDIYFDDNGLVKTISKDSIAIDMSPCTPSFATEMNAMITLSEAKMVEAPLIVIDQVAEDAFKRENIMCFASGEENSINIAMPVLDAVFSDIQVVGGPGVAQLAKAASTLQRVAETMAAVEAYSLMKASRQAISSLEFGDFKLPPTSPEAYCVLEAISQERFDGSFTVEMLMGEVSAAIMAGDDFESILPQAESAFNMLEVLAIIGGANKNPAALALLFRNEDKSNLEKYGLDWSRAESGIANEDDWDDEYDYSDTESLMFPEEDEFSQMGYSSN